MRRKNTRVWPNSKCHKHRVVYQSKPRISEEEQMKVGAKSNGEHSWPVRRNLFTNFHPKDRIGSYRCNGKQQMQMAKPAERSPYHRTGESRNGSHENGGGKWCTRASGDRPGWRLGK